MAYTNVWDSARPAGTVLANTIDTEIQAVRVDLVDRLSDIFGIAAFAADPIVPTLIKLNRTPTSKILGGTVSHSWRNSADSADNLIITDAGLATFRNTVNAPGFAGNLTGTILTAAQTNITSVGTLTALTVGYVNLNTVTAVGITSMLDFSRVGATKHAMYLAADDSLQIWDSTRSALRVSLSTAGVLSVFQGIVANVSGNLTGTILTAAQANITSVGTLTGLAVNGNVTNTAGFYFATNAAGNIVFKSQRNTVDTFERFRILIEGDLNWGPGNTAVDTTITRTGVNALSLGSGSFIAGSFSGNLTGTILTAAQANITSLGTLTGLTVNGLINAFGGILVRGIVTDQNTLSIQGGVVDTRFINSAGNQNNLILTDAGAGTFRSTVTATGFTGTILTAAQANITSVGTLTALTVSGAITMTAAASQIIPGATSFAIRDNANTIDIISVLTSGINTGLTTHAGNVNLANSGQLQVNGTKVVGQRATGWTIPTATQSKIALTNASTLAQTISFCAALFSDLQTHGMVGP